MVASIYHVVWRGIIVASLAVSGCGSPCGDATSDCHDIASSELVQVSEADITPAGIDGAVRPDGVLVNHRFYVGFTGLVPDHAFGMTQLDETFTTLSTRPMVATQGSQLAADLFTADGALTDLRISAATDDYLWCAFETARMPTSASPVCHNCSNFARYWLDSDTWVMDKSAQVACVDRPCVAPVDSQSAPPIDLPDDGTELEDDPAPFFHNGTYYVVRRRWGSARLPVTAYDGDLNELSRFELNLTSAVGNMSVSVSSFFHIDDVPWLVGAVYDGPPMGSAPQSYLVAVPLLSDLSAPQAAATVLSHTSDYQYYVAGARYDNGTLYITHNINARQPGGAVKGVLKVFDTTQGFSLLYDLVINEGVPWTDGHFGDDHLSVEVSGSKVYVFYPSIEDRLMVRTYEWR
jgi:hypothetical protein